MRNLRSLALAAALVGAGLLSPAQAAPLAADATSLGQPAATEVVQYGYRYGYGHSPQHRYRQHIRRQMLHDRRYGAHLRRQDQHYRRAYRYGY
ncbi:hypothetical protein [Methylobacterium sp. 77]|uniref:hypothetical protein n=1 Tax=Methylobacterium sp. 77 TaxID=1101192 RepID=UPI00035D3DC2|nr:hypothetical protein [Methylobacterium sp. 77]